ncbi:hypothetical protein ACFXO9_14940 [Nocardia tengchongensis]|uniref:hypothetical protein n=1 Tax=Nocardia tengchongensis TaxID=2055889 RepID=UPI003689C2E4
MAFRFAIPAYLLGSLYTANLRRVFNIPALAAYTVTAAAAGLIAAVAYTHGHTAREAALRIMAACQVNTAYIALPVFALLFGDASPIFPVILLQVCVLTTIVITIMESAPGESDEANLATGAVRRAVFAALTTPVVLACWAGIAANITKTPVPQWVLDALAMAGAAASPGRTLRARTAPGRHRPAVARHQSRRVLAGSASNASGSHCWHWRWRASDFTWPPHGWATS